MAPIFRGFSLVSVWRILAGVPRLVPSFVPLVFLTRIRGPFSPLRGNTPEFFVDVYPFAKNLDNLLKSCAGAFYLSFQRVSLWTASLLHWSSSVWIRCRPASLDLRGFLAQAELSRNTLFSTIVVGTRCWPSAFVPQPVWKPRKLLPHSSFTSQPSR